MEPISNANDFKDAAEANAFEEPELLTLPSGLRCRARRPRPIWWLMYQSNLPSSLIARARSVNKSEWTAEDVSEMAKHVSRVLEAVVIQPRIRKNPGPDEVDVRWVTDEDQGFIIRYAGGEISATGQSLEGFSRNSMPSAAGASGGSMEDSPKFIV